MPFAFGEGLGQIIFVVMLNKEFKKRIAFDIYQNLDPWQSLQQIQKCPSSQTPSEMVN